MRTFIAALVLLAASGAAASAQPAQRCSHDTFSVAAQAVTVTVCAGAPDSGNTIRVSRELGLNLPVICCHGALTKDFGANKTLETIPVPLQYAKPMIEMAQREHLAVAVYVDEAFYRPEGSEIVMDDMRGPGWYEVPSLLEVLSAAPTFIRFLGEASVRRMLEAFGDLPLSFRHESWFDFVECAVLNRNASKKNALARLAADFGIPAERVLAIGDSRNDVPMLRWAGTGVAMGNALAEVRQSVQHVTARNDQDGVALAIERFALTVAAKKTA